MLPARSELWAHTDSSLHRGNHSLACAWISRCSGGRCAACQQEPAGDCFVLCPCIFNSLLPAPSLSCCFLKRGSDLPRGARANSFRSRSWETCSPPARGLNRAGKEICLLQIVVSEEGDEIHISQAQEGWVILLNNHLYKPHLNKTDINSGRRAAWGLNNKKRIYFCRFRNPGRTTIYCEIVEITKKIICSDTRYYQNMSLL